MDKNEPDLVEQLHREAVQRRREQEAKEILGLYDTWDAAREVGLRRFLLQPFFVHAIRAEEPYLHIRGVNLPWRSSRFR